MCYTVYIMDFNQTYLKTFLALVFKCLSIFFRFADGDENEENIRGWPICSHNAGGCQELLRTIRTGKLDYHLNWNIGKSGKKNLKLFNLVTIRTLSMSSESHSITEKSFREEKIFFFTENK